MKTSTKIILIVALISFIGVLLFLPTTLGQLIKNGQLTINIMFWLEALFLSLLLICFSLLMLKVINNLKLSHKLFVLVLPTTFSFAGLIYTLININTPAFNTFEVVKRTLNINSQNNNNLIWAIVAALIYIIVMFLIFWIVCKPVAKVGKAVERLSDGKTKNIINIGGGKQFKEIEYNLNKINENYKASENLIKKTNIEYGKFIPKQFLKYLGKNNILELELGNQVKKEVTTMFCDIRNSTSMSTTLSLEENFNYINSYLKTVAPLIKKHNGFIDKYLGDGVLAVFPNANNAIECANIIVKTISVKNNQKQKSPSLEVGISLHTGEVVFGVVGDENRKSPTIISDAVNFAGKMEDINKTFGSNIIFSKNTLNALPSDYPLAYRFIGSLQIDNKGDLISIFESLECYDKAKRDKYLKNKQEFEQAVRYYYMGKFSVAKDMFEKVYKAEKEDKVCYLYYNKCEEKLAGGKGPLRI